MEQNADTGAQMTPVVDDKKKNGNGLKIATAIACIMAVCGIGFGVYGIMQCLQKDKQVSDLKAQISDAVASTDNINQSVDNAVTSTDDINQSINNSFELFSNSIDGDMSFYLSGYQEEPVGSVHIDDEHNMKIIVGQTKTVLLEEEEVVLAYYIRQASYERDGEIKRFNGYTPYVYYVKSDGLVYRIRVDSDSSDPEKINNRKDIVYIFPSSNPDSPVTMVDINGNVFQDVQ